MTDTPKPRSNALSPVVFMGSGEPDMPATERPDPETYADWWEVKYGCYAVRYDKYLDLYDLYAAERTKLKAAAAERDAALSALGECMGEIDDYIRQEYPGDHPVHERYRQRDFSANPARVFLQARQKGGE